MEPCLYDYGCYWWWSWAGVGSHSLIYKLWCSQQSASDSSKLMHPTLWSSQSWALQVLINNSSSVSLCLLSIELEVIIKLVNPSISQIVNICPGLVFDCDSCGLYDEAECVVSECNISLSCNVCSPLYCAWLITYQDSVFCLDIHITMIWLGDLYPALQYRVSHQNIHSTFSHSEENY